MELIIRTQRPLLVIFGLIKWITLLVPLLGICMGIVGEIVFGLLNWWCKVWVQRRTLVWESLIFVMIIQSPPSFPVKVFVWESLIFGLIWWCKVFGLLPPLLLVLWGLYLFQTISCGRSYHGAYTAISPTIPTQIPSELLNQIPIPSSELLNQIPCIIIWLSFCPQFIKWCPHHAIDARTIINRIQQRIINLINPKPITLLGIYLNNSHTKLC